MSTGETLTVDKYKLLNCLATGQSSQIWQVSEGDSSRHSAMKLLLPEALKDPERKATLKQEAKIGASFEHPCILKYYETVINKQHAYFIMEYFRAPNLKQQINADINSVHVRIRRLIELLCGALDHVHERGWLHKDMKPDNILFSKGSELRLIDFSLSGKPTGALSKMFGGSELQGTRTYLAPEQILRKPLTRATDIYSLGITLFETLTGKVPFKGTSPADLLKRHLTEQAPGPSVFNANITPEMDRLVLRMLSKKPDLRHRNIAEFMAEFRNIKIFKEAVVEIDKEKLKKMQEEEQAKSIDKRLDSRADALRQSAKPTVESKTPAPATAPTAKPATPPQPAAGPKPPGPPGPIPPGVRPPQGVPPGMPPGMPPRPQYPVPPGTAGPFPPGMPPGQYPPGPYPPGMIPPGMPPRPGMPGMPVPPQGWPAQPYPPGMMPPSAPGAPYPGGYPQPGIPGQPGMPPGYPPGMVPPGMPRPPQPGMPYPPGMMPGQPYPPGMTPPPPARPPGPPPGPPPKR